ncbi:G2/mitotic-specific cyclin-2 [Nymphaea thermarum]|nr:G2/mitotic-specific cyclin-2 [Nymphaea thermarum]
MRKSLQVVGITGMLLAYQYEEVYVPALEDFKKSILNTLQFSLSVPTLFVFMRRFLKAAESDTKMLKFPPSFLSSAAICAGKSLLKQFPPWNKTLTFHSTYLEKQIQ